MDPLNVVVPFTVFTEYRDRRLRGRDATGETPAADVVSPSTEESGCEDTSFASAETTVPTAPSTERIPS